MLGTLSQTGVARRPVRIGALATLSRNFQKEFLQPLLRRADVELVLRSGSAEELLRGLQSVNLDVVLTNQAPGTDALLPFVVHHLSAQRVSLVGAPALLGKVRGPAELLATHPVILPSHGSSVRTGFDGLADRLGVRLQIAAEVDDIAMMRLLVREGHALAVLPPIAVRDELAAGVLIEADELRGIVETSYAVTTKRRYPNPVVNSLLKNASKTERAATS